MSSADIRKDLIVAREHLRSALERASSDCDYLCEDLEKAFAQVHTLIDKMSCDEALERDRAVLLAEDPPPEGLGDWVGAD